MRQAAMSAITPPVFGLNVHRLGVPGRRAVVVEVLASVDGPHLIYKNEYFGAPVRNDSDTVWMKERQVEAMYRARFDERRHAAEALDALFTEAAAGRDDAKRAWLIAVAHPRVPRFQDRLTRDGARAVLKKAEFLTLTYVARRGKFHPLEGMDGANPRPGLRRWVAANTGADEAWGWGESWGSIHHDGSVTVATAAGGHPADGGHLEGWQVQSSTIECAIADFMALIRATAAATGNDEYDVRVGINWAGGRPLRIFTTDHFDRAYDRESTPLHGYTPVETTVNAAESDLDYHWHVHDLAQDCVNQGGVSKMLMIQPPARAD
jgi:hypothetical protein